MCKFDGNIIYTRIMDSSVVIKSCSSGVRAPCSDHQTWRTWVRILLGLTNSEFLKKVT